MSETILDLHKFLSVLYKTRENSVVMVGAAARVTTEEDPELTPLSRWLNNKLKGAGLFREPSQRDRLAPLQQSFPGLRFTTRGNVNHSVVHLPVLSN